MTREKITPRNLTARAAHKVLGNPANTRMESGVANCFPGLELDVRNLDRRFFPGLLFESIDVPRAPEPGAPAEPQGLKLLYLDVYQEPVFVERADEPWVQRLVADLQGPKGGALAEGVWYLDWVEQGGRRISMYGKTPARLAVRFDPTAGSPVPHDGMLVWRLLRGLEPDVPVTINLVRRDLTGEVPKASVQLTGYRRRFLTEEGVIDASYRPGEMTQSLCVPWTHDFRDCACHYWASNHPDVVIGEARAEQTLVDGEPKNPQRAYTYLDWLRADRDPSGQVATLNTIPKNRPYQIDHYQINQSWEELAFVLEGKEIGEVYQRAPREFGKPFDSAAEMIELLEKELAPLELTLALEYLYALFSVKGPEEAPKDEWPTLPDDVAFVRQFLTLVAVSEMTHLHWDNQILWELDRAGFFPPGKQYAPVLQPARTLPGGRPRALRRLTSDALDDFVAIEHPRTGFIDTAYARVVATLRQPEYPRHIYELAARIDTDGVEHYNRFRDVRQVLSKTYAGASPPYPYLRDVKVGTSEQAHEAIALLGDILSRLEDAYRAQAEGGFAEGGQLVQQSRQLMKELQRTGEDLARSGIGIPFWQDDT